MKNKILSLNVEFNVVRILDDNSSVNTGIISNYNLLSINDNKFPEILENIRKDFNVLIQKYTSKYPFNLEDK